MCRASVHQNLRDSRRRVDPRRLPRRCAAALSRFSSRLSPFYLRENGSCSFGAAFADSPKPFIRSIQLLAFYLLILQIISQNCLTLYKRYIKLIDLSTEIFPSCAFCVVLQFCSAVFREFHNRRNRQRSANLFDYKIPYAKDGQEYSCPSLKGGAYTV